MPLNYAKACGYSAPAVEKAFGLLRFVANADEAVRLSDAAGHLGISKSTAHGLIRALVSTGALTQPRLDELRDLINETVFFGLLHPWRVLIMATSEAPKPIKISSPPGSSIILMASAMGKVYPSQMDDAEVGRIVKKYGLPRFTKTSIVVEHSFLKEIADTSRGKKTTRLTIMSDANLIPEKRSPIPAQLQENISRCGVDNESNEFKDFNCSQTMYVRKI